MVSKRRWEVDLASRPNPQHYPLISLVIIYDCARSRCPALLGLQGVRYDEPFACVSFSVSSSFLALPPPQLLSVGPSLIRSLRPAIR